MTIWTLNNERNVYPYNVSPAGHKPTVDPIQLGVYLQQTRSYCAANGSDNVGYGECYSTSALQLRPCHGNRQGKNQKIHAVRSTSMLQLQCLRRPLTAACTPTHTWLQPQLPSICLLAVTRRASVGTRRIQPNHFLASIAHEVLISR